MKKSNHHRQFVLLLLLLVGLVAAPVQAGLFSSGGRSLFRSLTGKAGREATEQGAKTLSRQVGRVVVRNTDELAVAMSKCGSKATRWISDAGAEHADTAVRLLARHGDSAARLVTDPQALRLVSRFGDDSAEAILRHGRAVAAPLIEKHGAVAARALGNVSAQNGRRLVMLADGTLASHSDDLLSVAARYGDEAADFIWRNKGALAAGTVMVSFLANPEMYLNGTTALTQTLADAALRPLVESMANVAPLLLGSGLLILVVAVTGLLVMGKLSLAWLVLRRLLFRRKVAAAVNGQPAATASSPPTAAPDPAAGPAAG